MEQAEINDLEVKITNCAEIRGGNFEIIQYKPVGATDQVYMMLQNSYKEETGRFYFPDEDHIVRGER